MEEVFKDICFDGVPRYSVSNMGNVYSYISKRYIAEASKHKDHYRKVNLSDGKGNSIRISVHRLVWEIFMGPIPEGLEINHINHIKADCRLSNLEVVTHQENQQKMAYHYGTTVIPVGTSYEDCIKWLEDRVKKGKDAVDREFTCCSNCKVVITSNPVYHLCQECYYKAKSSGEVDVYRGVNADGTVKKGKSLRSQISKDELLQLLKEYTFFEIGKRYNVSDNAVRRLAKTYGMSTSDDDYWTDAKQERREQRVYKSLSAGYGANKRKVAQYTLDGEFVAVYDSISEPRIKLGISNISNCLAGRKKSAGGFIWKYYDE